MKKISIFLVSLLAFVASFANAAVITGADAVVTQLTGDGVDTITAIGGAILLLAGVAVIFKWAKAAIFG